MEEGNEEERKWRKKEGKKVERKKQRKESERGRKQLKYPY